MVDKAAIRRQLEKDFEAASARGRAELRRGPLAVDVRLRRGKIVILLNTGVEISFPPSLAQGLGAASRAELSDVVIEARGLTLHWPKLDADFYVPALARGILGNREWMMRIGRTGGLSKSEAKVRAARANGAKGGRPRKTKPAHRTAA
jgi:uncharacterized protein DUF2442